MLTLFYNTNSLTNTTYSTGPLLHSKFEVVLTGYIFCFQPNVAFVRLKCRSDLRMLMEVKTTLLDTGLFRSHFLFCRFYLAWANTDSILKVIFNDQFLKFCLKNVFRFLLSLQFIFTTSNYFSK